MSIRSKQGAAGPAAAGATERVTWPGKRSAAQQVAGRNRAVGPGKRSRTQGVPKPVRRPPPK
jgi:hypothetical protein